MPYWRWTDDFPSHLCDAAKDTKFMGGTNTGFFFTIPPDFPPPPKGPFPPWKTIKGVALTKREHASAVGTITSAALAAALTQTPYDKPGPGRCRTGSVGEGCVTNADCTASAGA